MVVGKEAVNLVQTQVQRKKQLNRKKGSKMVTEQVGDEGVQLENEDEEV